MRPSRGNAEAKRMMGKDAIRNGGYMWEFEKSHRDLIQCPPSNVKIDEQLF